MCAAAAVVRRPALSLATAFTAASASSSGRAIPASDALASYKRLLRMLSAADRFATHAAVSALKSLSCSSSFAAVRHFHAHLLKSNLVAEVHVASALLHAVGLHSHEDAHQLFDELPQRNLVTINTMLTSFARAGRIAAARALFDAAPHKDIISWSSLLEGYFTHRLTGGGLDLFREMMNHGNVVPDSSIFVTLLNGCCSLGSLPLLCKSVHAYAVRHNVATNTWLGTTIIDSYSKCGCLGYAISFFHSMGDQNVMHWTALICGLATHGYCCDAIMLLDEMRRSGVRPNDITFTTVLHACCHAGMIDKGKQLFRIMTDELRIEPSVHHYGCMVDMLAKAGRLEDAYAVIESMRVEPNAIIWTSFLAACKKHKNFEIAEVGINKVLAMNITGEVGGLYTLISDLHAMALRWDGVERVRKFMDARYVRKNRGSSFVELDKLSSSAMTAHR